MDECPRIEHMRRRQLELLAITVHPELLVEVGESWLAAIQRRIVYRVVDPIAITALIKRVIVFRPLSRVMLLSDHPKVPFDRRVNMDVHLAERPRPEVGLLHFL